MDNALDEAKILDCFDLDELKIIYDALTSYNNSLWEKLPQDISLYDANMATARSHEVLRLRDDKIEPLIKYQITNVLSVKLEKWHNKKSILENLGF